MFVVEEEAFVLLVFLSSPKAPDELECYNIFLPPPVIPLTIVVPPPPLGDLGAN